MRAPAMYKGIGRPGTLEIATLAAAGILPARLERPKSVAMPDISHGAPVIGRSRPSTGFNSETTALAASDDAWIALKRSAVLARLVARSTRIAETWLFSESSFAPRRLTGTPAMSDFFGSRSRSARNLRSAPAHIVITTVLTVPPTRLPSALISASGTDMVLYERWLVIDTLKIDFGASPRLRLRAPFSEVRAASSLPAAPIALTACGTSLPALTYCATAFDTPACSNSTTPSW